MSLLPEIKDGKLVEEKKDDLYRPPLYSRKKADIEEANLKERTNDYDDQE